ncbi:MAG: starch synthase [Betaproteobacteria bacterium RIFCSPLOWO2_12_FULL_62_58]|nr:MAG: starch synthase [Betaproteobacteria bacterium RIFCSPLOWO2_02_FULL_62_79]OGA53630.1 MAG: starch synthase [Betaproteobacteria bacterium RIFCSPLOWO2_12_FULL_62_58]
MQDAHRLRVLFVVSELAPWVKTGGLGEVAATLPAALRALGVDVRVLVPGYPAVLHALPHAGAAADFPHLGGVLPRALLRAAETPAGIPLFVVECPQLYTRPGGLYQDNNGVDWPDNHLRFGLLSRVAAAIASGVDEIGWRPAIVHCHDWQTGLAPAYLHYHAPHAARTVCSIHNVAYQGVFPPRTLQELGLPPQAFAINGVEYHGKLSFLKAGIQYADRLTTVSPTYAREIQTEAFGFGLDGLLRSRADVLCGILNGIDTRRWNPATDDYLVQRYDGSCVESKVANKSALQRRVRLPVTDDVPLLGVLSRFTHQKGLDLLLDVAQKVIRQPAQIVVLGEGEKALAAKFMALARAHRERCAAVIRFDEPLAHLIEAGADIFVMPSRYEPCGLNQMYSLRYGTPPVVRATGGLADTVVDCNERTVQEGTANGFVFEEPTPAALLKALDRAVTTWRDRVAWRRLQRNGMRMDFGWEASALRYRDLYRALI